MESSTDLPSRSTASTPPKASTGVKEISSSCKQEPAAKSGRKYAKYSFETRSAVIDAHERGEDWAQAARLHGVNRRTAFAWISSPEPRRIRKPHAIPKNKALNETEIDLLMKWISDEPRISLPQIAEKVHTQFGKTIGPTTMGRYLFGNLYTAKKEYQTLDESTSMIDQVQQRSPIEQLKAWEFLGRDLIWIDEVTLGLFCGHPRGPNKKYDRATFSAANVRGRPIQLAAAMNRHGILKHLVKKGLYTMDHCLEFVQGLIEKLKTESRLDNVAFVYDGAQCHSKLDELCKKENVKVIRLVPYSSELSPFESLWDETRKQMRRQLRETHERLRRGDSETLAQQDPLMECLEQCANALLTCVSGEHCRQLVDDVLRPLIKVDLKTVIKLE